MKSLLLTSLAGLLIFISSMSWSEQLTVTLSLSSMNCPMCSVTIKKTLKKTEGVNQINVDYDRKLVRIVYDSHKVNIQQLIKLTESAGFPSEVHTESSK